MQQLEQPSVLHAFLQEILRVTISDGRVFLGSFVGTDRELNILLLNTDEYRIGPAENPDGRYVGQVMIPWKLVSRVEAPRSPKFRPESNGLYT
jgi:small nuclear ribonucleoprotein (snRNP)-like protein